MKRMRQVLLTALVVVLAMGIMAFPAVAAKIAVPQNVKWDGSKACWDAAEDAFQYQVQLYKNGDKYKSAISTSGTSIELSGYMQEKGKYAFRVRVRDRISDDYGQYSQSSASYVQEKNQTVRKPKRTMKPSTSNTPGKENPGPGVVGKGWRQEGNRWWYRNDDGTYPKSRWFQVGNKSYYFDGNGYMLTGWIVIDDKQYYCQEDGSMAVGWIEMEESYFYFNESGIYEK